MEAEDDGSFSPMGLKVLVVDDDPFCLSVLDKMLRECKYHVTTCSRATRALSMLREKREAFDVVISDVHMPDMDGFKLLELIGLEMDLPVIMMSANDETDVVMKGVVYGACDYLVKPVRIEELRNIWQHVVRKRSAFLNTTKEEHLVMWDDISKPERTISGTFCRKRKERNSLMDPQQQQQQQQQQQHQQQQLQQEPLKSVSTVKRARVVWSFELHQQFVKAINQLGIDRAVPKRILEVMNIQGLTRENVASHLQKYRMYLKRLSGVNPEPFPIASFQAFEGNTFGGTMRVLPAPSTPALRTTTTSNSRSMGSQLNAATLSTLAQLQALQQAAHERGVLPNQMMIEGSGSAAPSLVTTAYDFTKLSGEGGSAGGHDDDADADDDDDDDDDDVEDDVLGPCDDLVNLAATSPAEVASFFNVMFPHHH